MKKLLINLNFRNNNNNFKIFSEVTKTNTNFFKYSKAKYQTLQFYNPDIEAAKYYKKYFKQYNKSDLEQMLKEKESIINAKLPNNSIMGKLTQYMSMMEYRSELEDIVQIIFRDIANSEETNLQDLSEYYFKQKGKMIRPHILILVSQYLKECIVASNLNKNINHDREVKTFAACVEVLHNASLLHDDIIDNSDKRRNLETAHTIFGIRNTVFGANYIISRAAHLMTNLNIPALNEIFSTMVYNLTYGECEQSLKKANYNNIDEAFRVYMLKTYYKTASLIALSLRGLAIIYELSPEIQLQLFNLGLHIGLVFQLVDDVIDVIYESKDIKKPAFKDLDEGVINSYVIFEVEDSKNKDFGDMANNKFKGSGEKEAIKNQLKIGNGIIKTQNLAMDHLIESFKILDNSFFIDNKTKTKLLQCFYFIVNRKF